MTRTHRTSLAASASNHMHKHVRLYSQRWDGVLGIEDQQLPAVMRAHVHAHLKSHAQLHLWPPLTLLPLEHTHTRIHAVPCA